MYALDQGSNSLRRTSEPGGRRIEINTPTYSCLPITLLPRDWVKEDLDRGRTEVCDGWVIRPENQEWKKGFLSESSSILLNEQSEWWDLRWFTIYMLFICTFKCFQMNKICFSLKRKKKKNFKICKPMSCMKVFPEAL